MVSVPVGTAADFSLLTMDKYSRFPMPYIFPGISPTIATPSDQCFRFSAGYLTYLYWGSALISEGSPRYFLFHPWSMSVV